MAHSKGSEVSPDAGQPGDAPRVAGDIVWLVGSGYATQAANVVVSIALRAVLGPASMGYVALAQIVTPYAPFLTLGMTQAAEREIAIEIGRGRPHIAELLEGSAGSIAVILGVVVATACAIGAMGLASSELAGTLAAAGAIILTQQVAVWATIRLRTRYRFRALGIWGAVGSIATITLTLVGAIVGGLGWALGGLVAGSALQGSILAWAARLGRPHVGAAYVARLARLSPGFLAVGLVAVILNSVDQIAVASLLGPTALGLYSSAYLGNAFLVRVPNLVGSVIYPRMQRDLGAHGEIRRLHETVRRTTEASLVVMGPFIALLFVGLPILVQVVLPAFVAAIPAMRLLLLGVAGLALAVPASQMLMTIDHLWRQVAITVAIIAGMATVYFLAWLSGAMSIGTAAAVDLVAYSLYGVVVQVAAARAAHVPIGWLVRLIVVTALPLVALWASAIIGDGVAEPRSVVANAVWGAAGALAYLLAWALFAGSYIKSQPTLAKDLGTVTRTILRRVP